MFRIYTKFLEIEKKKINNLIENWSKDFTGNSQKKFEWPTNIWKGEQPKQSKVNEINEISLFT